MTLPRRILLVDADAFHVAVARLIDPEGAGRAPLLIVGGSAEHRGVVTSASYEARRYGVRSAMPMARALRLCPGATIVPVPMDACVEKGRAMRAILQEFTPATEPASIDECYLDLSGTERLYRDETLEDTARRIRAAVFAGTGLRVSIGGGTSKFIAKLASGVAKPAPSSGASPSRAVLDDRAGVHIVPPGSEPEFMRRFALADINGIGPRFQERLARVGLRTVEDVLRHDQARLAEWFGKRLGAWLFTRARGVDDAPVEVSVEQRSISRDDTFARDIDDDDALRSTLAWLADRATGDLRKQGLRARTVTVRLRDADFRDRQASRTLAESVASARAVLVTARALLARLRTSRPVPARLLGVGLSGLVRESRPRQLSLLDAPDVEAQDSDRDRRLSEAVDALREKFGRDVIRKGASRR